MTNEPKIGVAMICKNESTCIAKCLESVKWADGIFVEDTGSTDDTVEIAKRYTPNVSFREWDDNYAASRNSVKAKVPAEFTHIISIDCDEELQATEEEVRAAVKRAGDAHSIHIWMVPTHGACASFLYPRIFRNVPECYWTKSAHNVLNAPSMTTEKGIVIKFGYSEAHRLDPQRTLRILTAAHAKDPKDSRILFYFAREVGSYYHRYQQGVDLLEEYFKLPCIHEAERVDALYLMAFYLWNLRRGGEARAYCLKAIAANPHFAGACRLMATMSYERNRGPWLAMAAAGTNEGVMFVR